MQICLRLCTLQIFHPCSCKHARILTGLGLDLLILTPSCSKNMAASYEIDILRKKIWHTYWICLDWIFAFSWSDFGFFARFCCQWLKIQKIRMMKIRERRWFLIFALRKSLKNLQPAKIQIFKQVVFLRENSKVICTLYVECCIYRTRAI